MIIMINVVVIATKIIIVIATKIIIMILVVITIIMILIIIALTLIITMNPKRIEIEIEVIKQFTCFLEYLF